MYTLSSLHVDPKALSITQPCGLEARIVPFASAFCNHNPLSVKLLSFRIRGPSLEFHNHVSQETLRTNLIFLNKDHYLTVLSVFQKPLWVVKFNIEEIFHPWFHAWLTLGGTPSPCFIQIIHFTAFKEVVYISINLRVFFFPLGSTMGHFSAKSCITLEWCNGNSTGLGARRLGFQQMGKRKSQSGILQQPILSLQGLLFPCGQGITTGSPCYVVKHCHPFKYSGFTREVFMSGGESKWGSSDS